MILPSQGFRHAVTLLLTNRVRALPRSDSPDAAAALSRLAEELVALAGDMHTPPQSAEWLVAEFERTVARVIGPSDLSDATRILATAGTAPRVREPRDLFLLYVPEDRLPIAAPFAIELAKRRVSVAFSEYEVASAGELEARQRSGLADHHAGVLLMTPTFVGKQWPMDISDSERFRLIRDPEEPATAVKTAEWVRFLVSGKNTVSS
jgi:hypothetical protein